MRGLKELGYFLSGFALATAAGMILRSSPAHAQGTWETTIPKVNTRSATRPHRQSPTEDVREDPQFPPATPVLNDGEREAVPADGDDPARLPATEARDGEADPQPGQAQPGKESRAPGMPADGAIVVTASDGLPDGIEPMTGDARLPADRAAFENPPAGYDALAFQIELDPATDARPARLARFEPYTPKGWRAGSWVIFPELETGLTATNNALRGVNARNDLIFDARPTLRAVTDWRQHALDIRASGLLSRYGENDFANERAYALEARARLDLSRRTNIEILGVHRLDPDSPADATLPSAIRGRAQYETNQLAATFNHRFNRLSVQLRGSVTDIGFEPGVTNAGVPKSNAERDNVVRDAAIRASWAFQPALSVFSEYAVNSRAFRALPSDGITRDSTGDRLRFGVSFGSTAKIWRGEVALGYGRQNASDGAIADAAGLIVDANLAWRPTELTSFLLTARTDFGAATDAGKFLSRTQTIGLEARHAFRRQLIGIAGLKLENATFEGVALTERATTAETGLDYFLSDATSISLRYQHLWFTSTAANADYTADTVRLAFRYRP